MAKRVSNSGKICSTDDCGDKATCAGLCGACYQWHWTRSNEGVAAGQRYRKRMKRIQNRIDALPAPPKRSATVTRSRGRGESRAYLN